MGYARFYILNALALLLALTSVAYAQLDFDGDGTSDLLSSTTNGSNLHWQSIASLSSGATVNKDFGLSTDFPIPGDWVQIGVPSLASVQNGKSDLIWKLNQSNDLILEKKFGKVGDYIISGADFDGDGYADAAVMTVKGHRCLWRIAQNLFANEPYMTARFYFGAPGERIFFLNPDDSYDWPAIIKATPNKKKARVILHNPLSGVRRVLNGFPVSLTREPRPRPFPIKSPEGGDVLGVVTTVNDVDTALTVYALNGSRLVRFRVSGLRTFSVGEYAPADPGEEVALSTGSKVTIINPFSGSNSSLTQSISPLIGEFNVAKSEAPTPVPTATVAPTETP